MFTSHTRYNRILTGWRNWVKNMFVNSKNDVKSHHHGLKWHFNHHCTVCKTATELKSISITILGRTIISNAYDEQLLSRKRHWSHDRWGYSRMLTNVMKTTSVSGGRPLLSLWGCRGRLSTKYWPRITCWAAPGSRPRPPRPPPWSCSPSSTSSACSGTRSWSVAQSGRAHARSQCGASGWDSG